MLIEKESAAELAHRQIQKLESENKARVSALQSDLQTKDIEIQELNKRMDQATEQATLQASAEANGFIRPVKH